MQFATSKTFNYHQFRKIFKNGNKNATANSRNKQFAQGHVMYKSKYEGTKEQ